MNWKARDGTKFDGNLKKYFSEIRGIDDIEEYLNPSHKHLHSPLLLKNIKVAAERVMQGISDDETITVFADP